MVLATFGHVLLPFCMVFVTCWQFNFSFAWYLLHFHTSNLHLGLLRFFWLPFRVLFEVSVRVSCSVSFWFNVGFLIKISNVQMGFFGGSLGFHLGFLEGFTQGFIWGFFRASVWISFQVSFRVSLGFTSLAFFRVSCHGFLSWFLFTISTSARGFLKGFIQGFFRVSLGIYLGFR